ncbi:MAG: tetratricopeptide repeat protein [Bacteroidaceae bacterium]|nr:tetratricopeptide repeat protein [Bacteroidaceae bacterium]
MDLQYLIEHPEQLNKDTLHKLRERLAQHPYHQTARMLMLQNLFLLHDPSFGEELRRTALFVPNRKALFNMVEGAHYELQMTTNTTAQQTQFATEKRPTGDRTNNLIENFLAATPDMNVRRGKRTLTVADATTDYAAYLLELDDMEPEPEKHDELINSYIENGNQRVTLQEQPTYVPNTDNEETNEDYFTEILARIYTKQGNYDKAIEIITKLNLNYPKKSSYFADQLRFLRKLQLINNKTKS